MLLLYLPEINPHTFAGSLTPQIFPPEKANPGKRNIINNPNNNLFRLSNLLATAPVATSVGIHPSKSIRVPFIEKMPCHIRLFQLTSYRHAARDCHHHYLGIQPCFHVQLVYHQPQMFFRLHATKLLSRCDHTEK